MSGLLDEEITFRKLRSINPPAVYLYDPLGQGLKEARLADNAAALTAFAGVVGKDWVMASDADRDAYSDAYAPGPQDQWPASAAVAPASVEEVQSIVRLANEHNAALLAAAPPPSPTATGVPPGVEPLRAWEIMGNVRTALGYKTSNEEILGYLVHGLAEWYFGDALLGADEMEFFQTQLAKNREDTTAPPAPTLDWLTLYSPLVDRYKPDFALVRAALQPKRSGTIPELRTALAEVQQVRKSLKTSGAFLRFLTDLETSYQREISSMTLEEQQRQMEADKKHRQADLELLAEVNALVPSLVQGYDYTRAIDMLSGTRLETADVRTALDGRLYLYTQSRDFIRQLTTDLTTKGWTGTITRREGGQLTGRITCNAAGTQISVTLDRGTLTLPFESLTPETLVEIALSLGAQVTDSTDYYRRQENTAAFARLTGLTQLSTTIANQLMEENASFLMRWTKVMASGI